MEKLVEILEDLKPGVDFVGKTGLVTGGILDSFAVLNLISEISDEFDVDIPVGDIVPANFDSLETIMALIEKLS